MNINGHISESFITQQRGIRQGDSISPLLFNIAFDLFLRSIQQNSDFKGFDFHSEADLSPPSSPMDDLATSFQHLLEILDNSATLDTHNTTNFTTNSLPSLAVKTLAYADDTLVYLRDNADLQLLLSAINTYMKASNYLLNYHKTTALSGSLSNEVSGLVYTRI